MTTFTNLADFIRSLPVNTPFEEAFKRKNALPNALRFRKLTRHYYNKYRKRLPSSKQQIAAAVQSVQTLRLVSANKREQEIIDAIGDIGIERTLELVEAVELLKECLRG